MRSAASTSILLGLLVCAPVQAQDLADRLSETRLPPGFRIALYAEDVPSARAMALSESGTLFVGSRRGDVYAIEDHDADYVADRVHVIASDLNQPVGVALYDGDLYVTAVSRILRLDDIEQRLTNPPLPVTVVDDLPDRRRHGWKFIAFGPDGKLYTEVGAPCNVCDEGDPYATILRMNPDGSGREIVARGVRHSVGFTWHPETGQLYFTDNGRDWLGDDIPACELNRVSEPGQHFGFPYIHAGDLPDPEFGAGHDPADYTPPVQKLGPHVAPLGVEFYAGAMFPLEYRLRAFIAEHGSWNRSEKIGYRITMVTFDEQHNAVAYETFADGWLQGQESWGRPVDLEWLPDGSMLVSDDQAGAVYRIYYSSP